MLHAATVVMWAVGEPDAAPEELTRIRMLDPLEEAALESKDQARARAAMADAAATPAATAAAETRAARRAETTRAEDENAAAEAAVRAVRARIEAGRAEALQAEAEQEAIVAGAAARSAVERLEQSRRAEAESAVRAPSAAPRKLAEAAEREESVREAERALLAANRTVEAARQAADDARVEAARAEAMKAEAVRHATAASRTPPAQTPKAPEAKPSEAKAPEAKAPEAKAPPAEPPPKPTASASAQEPAVEQVPAQAAGGVAGAAGGGPVTGWLPFVRGEGAGAEAPDPDARYISDRNRRAPKDTRAAAQVARANGDGSGAAAIATRISTAEQEGAASRSTAARVDQGQPVPPKAASAAPPPARRTTTPETPRSTARGEPPSPPPPDTVELPYVAEAPGPAPAAPLEAIRLSAGAVDPPTRAGPAGEASASRRAARRTPVAPPPAPAAAPAPAAVRPTAPRPPLEDDFWSASALSSLVEPTVPSASIDTTPAPRPDTFLLGAEDASARGWSDLAILDERAALSDQTRFGARSHPLAPWLNGVDDTLRQRWIYPPALQALGVEGTVIVRFHVSTSGVVSNPYVHSSAGHPELDLAALAALPARVAAMPSGSGRGQWLEWTFRYRAPAP
ncbi:MAG: TonB family protein [Pseudomonadota bacterium]|nr:TonB family protein [Pseudomonadota bacterium]